MQEKFIIRVINKVEYSVNRVPVVRGKKWGRTEFFKVREVRKFHF